MNRTIFEQPTFDKLIRCMTAEILLAYRGQELPVLVGIHTRGANLAVRIAKEIKKYSGVPEVTVGFVDISFYRDDLSKLADKPRVGHTQIPESIEGKSILLIDDVLYTGRTVRAAMDALNDLGRPKDVKLAVFIDRGHRELPIEANFVGLKVPTTATEVIHVHFTEAGDGVDNVEISNRTAKINTEIYCIKHRAPLRGCGCKHDVYGIPT